MSVCPPKTSPNTSKCPQSPHHISKLDPSDRQKIDRNEFQHRVWFLSIFCRFSVPYLVSACRPKSSPNTSKCFQGPQHIPKLDPLDRQKIDRNEIQHRVRFLSIFCRFSAPYLVSACPPKTFPNTSKYIYDEFSLSIKFN